MKSEIKHVHFWSNGVDDDRRVLRLLLQAEIPYIMCGPISDQKTPILEYGYWQYHGLEDIKEFIEAWKTDKLPPLDL